MWISHVLSPYQLRCRVDACKDLIQWLSSGQMGGARMDPHLKIVMLTVEVIIYWEVLPNDCIVTADVYFLYDNARSPRGEADSEKLLQLGWITIPHPQVRR